MVVLVIEVGAELVTRLRGTFARREEVQFHHVEPRSEVVISAALQFQPQVVVLGMGVIPHNTIRPLWPRLGTRAPRVLLAQRAPTPAERYAWAREGVAGVYDVNSDYPTLVAELEPGAASRPELTGEVA